MTVKNEDTLVTQNSIFPRPTKATASIYHTQSQSLPKNLKESYLQEAYLGPAGHGVFVEACVNHIGFDTPLPISGLWVLQEVVTS